MSSIGDLFKKAQDAINNFRGGPNSFLGKDGDIVYSKNNVCVHEPATEAESGVDDIVHTPGYLTIHCQQDETVGVTLILQWLPNTTLQKNPASIRSVSPRPNAKQLPKQDDSKEEKDPTANTVNVQEDNTDENTTSEQCSTEEDISTATSVSAEIQVEMNGDVITVTSVQERPKTLTAPQTTGQTGGGLGVPSINLIPNTPVDNCSHQLECMESTASINNEETRSVDTISQSSLSTSGADELSENDDDVHSSSCDDSDNEPGPPAILSKYRESCASILDTTPERFALEHHLILKDDKEDDKDSIAIGRGRAMYSNRSTTASLFTVNLGKMRSMRLFYSNNEYTSGQLVIASSDSHYKILHFHHGGLDKLAQLFEQWSAIKARSVKDGSPSAMPDKHLLICQPAVSKSELDPEEGLYDRVNLELWKSYQTADGSIDDSTTVRKAIFFASMDPTLRKDIWPFLLRVYPWNSTLEQRESIRNDLFLDYQNLRKKRMKKITGAQKSHWASTENTIRKDVVRTDRKNPFFYGDDNQNLEVMTTILLNYATAYPDVNYIQGMSDLLAPLLCTLRDESDSYWSFAGLMHMTVFSSTPKGNENIMEQNLEYLRALLELMVPDFFVYLSDQKGDALQLMFVHRWILLSFKREFPEDDALHIWEACWARYRTQYFHLFVCVAIVSIYGQDVISQRLPHDEILLYFSSLAMHMDARVVMKKARGLLHDFVRRERIPCTLAGLCETELEQWDSHRMHQQYDCAQVHRNNEPCPFV